jgi:hypothetical protein
VDRERDQVLLHSFVELSLDAAAIGIGPQDEPLPRRAQLRQLEPKTGERLAQCLDGRSLQLFRPPGRVLQELSVIARAASSSPARRVRDGSLPADSPARTIVTATASS